MKLPNAGLAVVALCVTSLAAHAQSPFAGDWRGKWTDPIAKQSGAVRFLISPNGAIEGLVGNANANQVGVIAGAIAPDGIAALTYAYNSGDTFYRAEGRLVRAANQMTGALNFLTIEGASLGQGAFALVANAQPGEIQSPAPSVPAGDAGAGVIPTGE
jgi:hypothetical protein